MPAGTPDHDSGGEMSLPSQVYSAGIMPPGGNAGLIRRRGMASSMLSSGAQPQAANPEPMNTGLWHIDSVRHFMTE